MKLVTLKTAVAFALSMSASSVFAGDFTNVPYTTPNATVVNGANNPAADQLFLNAIVFLGFRALKA